jgi:hypothetical protein
MGMGMGMGVTSSPGRPVLGLPAFGTTPTAGTASESRQWLDGFRSFGILFGEVFRADRSGSRGRLIGGGYLVQGLLRDDTLGIGLRGGLIGLWGGLLGLGGGLLGGGLLDLGGLFGGGLGLDLGGGLLGFGIRGWDFTLSRGRNILFTGDPAPKLADTIHDTSSMLLMVIGFTRGPTLGSTPTLFTVIFGRSHVLY